MRWSRGSRGVKRAAAGSKLASELELAFPLPQGAQAQRIELDKALRIAMVVSDRPFLEGHEFLVVERIFALATDHRDRSLVEFQRHAAGDEFLALVDR